MKKSLIVPAIVFSAALILPLAAYAQVSLPYFGGNPPFVSCSGVNCTTCDIFATAQRVIYFGMTLALFILAPIMITVGGIMIVISGGSEERLTKGKKMVTGSVVGILIALCAFLIVNLGMGAIGASGAISGMSRSGLTISCTATSPYVAPTVAPTTNNSNDIWPQ